MQGSKCLVCTTVTTRLEREVGERERGSDLITPFTGKRKEGLYPD
jgi:hypothetical protein